MSDENRSLPQLPSLQHQLEVLQERASKDTLSGLLNRGTAELYINQRLNSMAPGDGCALFIVDVDNFKQVNDTLGHQAGDQAIRQTARILSGLFRATDIVGRLGGDEFIIFISGTITEPMIRKKGEEICQQLQMVIGSGPSVALTVSVGIYIVADRAQTFEDLYRSADLALYKAKKNGKHNFFVKCGEGVPEHSETKVLPVNTISLVGLLEHMDSGVALLEMGDPVRLIYVSPSFCRLIGAEVQTYTMPRRLSEVVHPDDLENLEETLRDGLAGNECVDHTHRVSADGAAWRWWHIRAIRIEYSNPHPVMLITATDVSQFKASEHALLEVNERLQSAFEQTTQGLWEVDIPSRTFTLFQYSRFSQSAEPPHGDFPDFLLSNGWIHPASAEGFRSFARELLEGRREGYGNFIIQYQDTGCYGWATLSYRRLSDDGSRSARAVGIIEKLSREFAGRELQPAPRHPLPEALTPYLMVVLYGNLSRDSVHQLWIEGKNLSGTVSADSCTEVLRRGAEKIFSSEERQTLSRYFDREQLLKFAAGDERWFCLEYRRVDGSGSIYWVNLLLNLVEDPLTREEALFACLLRTDSRHRREQKLGIEVVRDPVTGLCDRATLRTMVEAQIKQGSTGECAVALVHLGGLSRLSAGDHRTLERNRRFVSAAMSAALGPGCVVGQYSQDELAVFFSEMPAREMVKQVLEEAFSFVRLMLAGTVPMSSLRFVAGVACAGVSQADYAAMVAHCLQLCQMWRNAASDMVVFGQEGDDWTWDKLRCAEPGDQIRMGSEKAKGPLTEEEKDVALRCLSDMLSADSPEESIRDMLNAVGTYYRADRVYVLMLTENRCVVTMLYEWTSPRKPSIQQAVSGLKVEQFPMLCRCMERRAPVFLARRGAAPAHGKETETKPWYFSAFPLMDGKEVTGFLCIENGGEHRENAALAAMLVPHILGEEKRFRSRLTTLGERSDALLQRLPNLRSYMDVICALNSERYSSLGAVCLDVPGLPSINGSLGFAYGGRLLRYAAKMLSEIFGSTYLFRTWDTEFVALCPDTTQQVFTGRCSRLRSALQRRYPGNIRIGYAWSEGVFSGKTLVNEARSIMRCERAIPDPVRTTEAGGCRVGKMLPLEQFTVYFQPKINMDTGALVGAEALVRGMDHEGNLIPPDRFIGLLEESGDIRELDLYVLNHTLAQMERWRAEGRKLIPVSVNFSRVTLFDSTAPASVLAVQSRYPLLPPEVIEVEITESAGGVGSYSLSEAIDRFREFGLRFALDDFGSQYANIGMFTHVKFDAVKLDRTLIADVAVNPRSQMLVRNLAGICRTCGMACVAEGVETRAQVDALLQAGCVCGQGYYFDRPLPAEAFETKYLPVVPSEPGGECVREDSI